MPKIFREALFALLLGYWIVSGVTAYDIFTESNLAQAFFAFISPHLAWVSGSGIKGSFLVGSTGQKIFGLFAGVIVFVLASFLMPSEAYILGIDPINWLFVGFFIGFVIASRQEATVEA